MSDIPAAANGDVLAPGTQLDAYTIDGVIGSGGMATVYLARRDDSGEAVAVKVLHSRFASVPQFVQRFEHEARAASALSHRNVIRVFDVSTDTTHPYIVMEYLRGETLADRSRRLGRMSTEAIARILLPLVSAVAAAHSAGIVHRDLKPDNIILAKSEEGERPVLLDFGISKVLRAPKGTGVTQAGQVVGTPYYMSPEQIRSEDLDGRADQYALGVIMYELATGVRPFRAEQSVFVLMAEILLGQPLVPSHIEPSILPAFEALVLRSMSVRREERFPTTEELGRALLPFASADTCRLWAPVFGVDPNEVEPYAPSAPASVDRTSIALSPGGGTVNSWLDTQPANAASAVLNRALTVADLRAHPGLSDVSTIELEAFCKSAAGREVPTDATIFLQGQVGDTCFALIRGALEISKDVFGTKMVLDVLEPGAFAGQDALVEKAARSVTARAIEDSLVIELSRDSIDRQLAAGDQVALRLLELLAIGGIRRLRVGTRRLAKLIEERTVGRQDDGRAITASRPLEQLRAAVREWSVRIDER
ncbi:MAG: protein kinase [Polyangiaceae bacterium]|nr:protein kinase [Polyangiaceae bacterium]